MDTLKLQDVFEPYFEGRRSGFATIEPGAVEKARKLKEKLEELRRAERDHENDEAA